MKKQCANCGDDVELHGFEEFKPHNVLCGHCNPHGSIPVLFLCKESESNLPAVMES